MSSSVHGSIDSILSKILAATRIKIGNIIEYILVRLSTVEWENQALIWYPQPNFATFYPLSSF